MIWNGITLVQYSTLLLLPQMINKKETLQKVRIFNKPNNSSSFNSRNSSIDKHKYLGQASAWFGFAGRQEIHVITVINI